MISSLYLLIGTIYLLIAKISAFYATSRKTHYERNETGEVEEYLVTISRLVP